MNKRAIFGYILLFLLFLLLAAFIHKGKIEDELTQQAQAQLNQTAGGITGAHTEFTWLDGKVRGKSGDDVAAAQVIDLLHDDMPQAWLNDGTERVSLVPSSVTAIRQGEVVRLTGTVPSQAHSQQLEAAASLGQGVTGVDNQLKVVDNATSAPWLAGTPEFLQNFLATGDGTASLADSATLTGTVASNDIREALGATAAALSPDQSVDNQLKVLVAEPEEFHLHMANGKPKLSGVVRDVAVKDAIGRATGSSEGISIDPSRSPAPWSAKLGSYLPDFLGNTVNGRIDAKGNAFAVSGTTTPKMMGALVSGAEKLAPGLEITSDLVTKEPAVLHLARKGKAIGIGGIVPDENSKARALDLAKKQFPGYTIDDQIEVSADRGDAWWGQSAPWLVETVFNQTEGDATLSLFEDRLEATGGVAGKGRPVELANAIKGTLPAGVGIKTDFSEIATAKLPNPAAAQPTKSPEIQIGQTSDGAIVANGIVPDQGSKKALLSRVVASAGGARVIDQIKIDSAVNKSLWLPGLSTYVPAYFKSVDEAGIKGSDKGIEITGVVPSADKRASIGDTVAGLVGKGIPISNKLRIAAAAPAPTSAKIGAQLKELQVYFDTNSAEVTSKEAPKIAQAAAALKGLPASAKLLVGGHADPRGNADYNRRLSIQRASAVRDRLVKLGISTSRMEVRSFGETDAVAAGSEAVSHNLSRRVEIRIAE